ncbi:MAG: serine hydrolase domain-containing protein [Cyclobacteriaceae bacterium]
MKLLTLLSCLLLSAAGFAQNLPQIDALIEKELSTDQVPAIAVAVIDSGKVVHMTTSGFKDWEKKLKADNNTSFHIASVSKVVTNLAIFKLVEKGKIDLKDDINNYLPFSVKNPHYPNDKITVAELLNHRSGIRDNYKIYGPLWSTPKGDPETELKDFLRSYLTEDGKLYTKKHFESNAEYKSYKYSNTGVSLLALIVENISNLSYEVYCQNEIFKPLNMTNTSWFLKNLNAEQVTKTYTNKDSTRLKFNGHNGYPDYPAGQLRTSLSDFSRLLAGYLNSDNSEFILTKKTTNQITPIPQIAQNGFYTWFLTAMNNRLYYAHEGGDTGVRTVAIIDVYKKNAIVIFSNAEYRLGPLLKAIENKMWGE